MSEAQIENQVEGPDVQPEEGGGEEKAPKTFDAVALRELRRARRLIRDSKKGEPISPEADLAIGIANVLALLNLAAAIRDHGSLNGTP